MKECGEQSEPFINARVQLLSTKGASLWAHASSIVLNMNIFSLCTCPESQLLLEVASVRCNHGHFCSLAGAEALFPRGGLVLRVPGGRLFPAHGRRPSLPLHRRGSPTDRPQHTEWLSRSNLVGLIAFPVTFGVKRTERCGGRGLSGTGIIEH